jgi:hypothetical protein
LARSKLATRDYSRLSCGGGDTQLGPSTRISAARAVSAPGTHAWTEESDGDRTSPESRDARRHPSRNRHRSLKASASRKPFLRPGTLPGHRYPERQVPRARIQCARPPSRSLGKDIRDVLPEKVRTVCYLSAEFLLGPRRQMIQTLRLMQLLTAAIPGKA